MRPVSLRIASGAVTLPVSGLTAIGAPSSSWSSELSATHCAAMASPYSLMKSGTSVVVAALGGQLGARARAEHGVALAGVVDDGAAAGDLADAVAFLLQPPLQMVDRGDRQAGQVHPGDQFHGVLIGRHADRAELLVGQA